ncbi:MAG: 3-methylmercaptopropionyl-CoA dehydrogenase (DmdC) [uncultured Acidimicrobiales bacterium]|uniref:3-methylmercaptopropionyl-CoA dehydrogenase n=1 Tax=uncultured Acidimicrobiales bacterium TaxID=310071 RepID=A0A6J4IWH7_9ACTN|nr:MAG: 3-methylmercaptopropionyl-CoA dehydrogenase (DmdC) [uncultured Acidimicrobiales bacterium]
MSDYSPPLDEIRFVLEHVAGLDELSKLEGFEHADIDSTMAVLEEFGRFVVDKVLPTNRVGDERGSHVAGPPDDPTVVTADGFKEAYAQYVEAGWGTVPFDTGFGGGGFPWTVGVAMQELLNSGNVAFAMAPLLTQGALDMLFAHGSEEQKQVYLPKLVTGEWTGTMNLTEPDAGSDLGAIRTRAVPDGQGTYRITGTKIYITFGEHDLAENIVHLVLARTPGAPPGTKGVSCFIVPKHLVDQDGSLGRRNGVKVVSVEHKMGIRASPTCVLDYDEAVGYLVGDENAGMRYMFTMMNTARLSVGVEGLGLCEAAYQRARQYARERRQGRAPGAAGSSAIVEHADVRRMLLTMKASTEALRALHYFDARQIDLGHHHPDEAVRAAATELAGLLTPMSKGWGTDLASEITSLAIQVFGGMGYIEETGLAQLYRDARITAIYEGTNGIQAMDLVGRKLPMRGGGVVADLEARMRATVEELRGSADLVPVGDRLAEGLDVLHRATEWILAEGAADPVQALAAATPYLRLFSQVVGGWLLGVEALAATRAAPADFAEAKMATALFFADHILPTVHGLLPTITAGKHDLFALSADQL